MTPDTIISFANHKYGEQAYLIEEDTEFKILTAKSVWRIMKNDLRRFGHYTLFHSNHIANDGHYHKQCCSQDLNWLVYYAFMHDYDKEPYNRNTWDKFCNSYVMYQYGRKLYESCMRFAFLSGDDISYKDFT